MKAFLQKIPKSKGDPQEIVIFGHFWPPQNRFWPPQNLVSDPQFEGTPKNPKNRISDPQILDFPTFSTFRGVPDSGFPDILDLFQGGPKTTIFDVFSVFIKISQILKALLFYYVFF